MIPNPKDLKATALFEQWASVELTDFDAFATELVQQNLFNRSVTLIPYFPYSRLRSHRLRGLEPIAEVVNTVTKRVSDKLDIYDQILAKQKYMAGDKFSLIDIFYMPYTWKLFEAGSGALIESRPNVKAWWERVSARESWKDERDIEAHKAWVSMVERLG